MKCCFYGLKRLFRFQSHFENNYVKLKHPNNWLESCLLYTSDAADDTPCVDLGGRRIIKKKN